MEKSIMICKADFFIIPPSKIIRAVGIDLGTTNCTVAEVLVDTKTKALPPARCLEIDQQTSDGTHTHLLVPSIVVLSEDQEIVGEGAKRLRAKSSENGLAQNISLFYDCKNDIGIKKTYHKAPAGYRSAADVSSRILYFLHQAAKQESSVPIDRAVVTVPASFQAGQRKDTLFAAQQAGLEIKAGDLLDEPVAAFIDYFTRFSDSFEITPLENKRLLIFDFGGGTCDVAIFNLFRLGEEERISISPLAVSRYHRLGGGDIDTAILHEEIIPQLLKQNNLSHFSLGFQDKKRVIEPAFIGLAEALKTGLCREIRRMLKFGKYNSADKNTIIKIQPGAYSCRMPDGRSLRLQNPKLSAKRLEEILDPFLSTDLLYARETEYQMTCSIFAPIQDAIDRSNLKSSDLNYCLLVGGSSLIPQVELAIRDYFPKTSLLTYPDPDSIQTAVARGAAYHALSLALYGKPIIQPVCNDTISLITQSGPIDLIPKGAILPYPAKGEYQKIYDLTVPKTSLLDSVSLRLEIVAGKEQRPIMQSMWDIPAPVNKGDGLCLEFCYDENQCLNLRMKLSEFPEQSHFAQTIENPLTNVVNPQTIRLKIDELEEDMKTGKISADRQPAVFTQLAENYAELHQYEKAIEKVLRTMEHS